MAIVTSRICHFYGNKRQLVSYVLFTSCFILQSLWMPIALAADSAGQKAHFQVEDKSGEMKITATKDQAKVIAQADSVQVVVKPGTADYPVLKSDKPVVHVTQPGWSSISIRKSTIFKRKKPSTKQTKNSVANKSWTTLVIGKRLYLKSAERSMSGQKLKNIFSREGCSFFPQKQTKRFERKSTQDKARNVSGSKKSVVKYGGFHVSGDAGKLKMHVTRDETTLSSESGGVDISLNKHPASSSAASDQRNMNTQPQMYTEESADKAVHIATELENSLSNFSGLRKSVVTKLKTDWDWYNNRRLVQTLCHLLDNLHAFKNIVKNCERKRKCKKSWTCETS